MFRVLKFFYLHPIISEIKCNDLLFEFGRLNSNEQVAKPVDDIYKLSLIEYGYEF